MALTANLELILRGDDVSRPSAMKVLNGSTIWNGALCSNDTTTGRVKPYDGTSADTLVGWHLSRQVTGNADGTVTATIHHGGFTVAELPVAALANDDSDIGAIVYASDDGTYTITDPGATGNRVGIVVSNGRLTGTADVRMDNVLGSAR